MQSRMSVEVWCVCGVIIKNIIATEFVEMQHGWLIRGLYLVGTLFLARMVYC